MEKGCCEGDYLSHVYTPSRSPQYELWVGVEALKNLLQLYILFECGLDLICNTWLLLLYKYLEQVKHPNGRLRCSKLELVS